jgi:hypothetical protein
MNEDKKKIQKRKAEQKMKLIMKKAGFNIDTLKREIYSHQFRFVDQPSWKQPFSTAWPHSSNDMKNKNQQPGSPGARE